MSLEIPEAFAGLFEPHRFKVFYGGRDSARSWFFTDPAGYDNLYEGNCRTFAEGAYFREDMEPLDRAGRIGDVPPKVAGDVLLGRGYAYAKQILPHDGGNVNSHTEQTDAQLLEGFGLKAKLMERTKDVERDVNNPARSSALSVRQITLRRSPRFAAQSQAGERRKDRTVEVQARLDLARVSSFRGFSVYQAEHGLRVRAANDNVKPRRAVAC